MGKLLKYEYETSKKPMFQVCIIFTIISLIMQVYLRTNIFNEGNIDENSIIYTLFTIVFIFVAVVGIIGGLVAFYLRLSNIFRKDIYGDEGYFLFSLPVNGYQITISKILIAVFWSTALFIILATVNLLLLYLLYYVFVEENLKQIIVQNISKIKLEYLLNFDLFIYLLQYISSLFLSIIIMFSAVILDYKIGKKKRNSQMWVVYAILMYLLFSLFTSIFIDPEYRGIFSYSVSSNIDDSLAFSRHLNRLRENMLLEFGFNIVMSVLLTIFVGHNTDKRIEKI